jgi:hypothetical protein
VWVIKSGLGWLDGDFRVRRVMEPSGWRKTHRTRKSVGRRGQRDLISHTPRESSGCPRIRRSYVDPLWIGPGKGGPLRIRGS